MKIFGYVRDKDGNFDNRKNKVLEFSKQMDFPIDKFICEKSSENYEDMKQISEIDTGKDQSIGRYSCGCGAPCTF